MANPKAPKTESPEGDPKRGDEILKRMLQAKPKPHDQMVAERKAKRPTKYEARTLNMAIVAVGSIRLASDGTGGGSFTLREISPEHSGQPKLPTPPTFRVLLELQTQDSAHDRRAPQPENFPDRTR